MLFRYGAALVASFLSLASTPVAALSLQSDFIFTKEVTYCNTGRAVQVERFDIRYYRNNQSIGFDISARSVAADLNADLNIQLYAYNKNYINVSVDLCTVIGGALCPLPQYQFDGSFAYILPDSLNINLPAIAFSVPDLDAYARIILTDRETGQEALCLGATLSNGKSVYLPEVQWALAGLAIGAFVVALIHSFWPLSPFKSGPEWRFATIMTYFQHVALCGFLSLDYPVVYKNFTLNFAWAQGLIYIGPIDRAINRMRYMTGGVNRERQTYTIIAENFAVPGGSEARSYASAAAYAVPTVQAAPSFNLISGIETTAQLMGITYPNAFMTVFIVFLLLVCAMIAICSLFILIAVGISLLRHRRVQSSNLRYFLWTNGLRTLLVGYTPIILFIFWQFLHKNESGWLAVMIAALALVIIHLAIAYLYWHISKIAHKALNSGSEEVSLRWTTVQGQFKRSGQGYLLMLAAAQFISAAFVAFAQGHALVQLVPLIVIEVGVFLAFCIWRPFANRGSNILMIFISLFKIIAYGLLVVFYTKIASGMNGIIVAVIGFALVAVQGIMVLILFIVTVYNLGAGLLWARQARREAEDANAQQNAMSEKRTAGPFLNRGLTEKNPGGYGPVPTDNPNSPPPPVSNLFVPDNHPGYGTPLTENTATMESTPLAHRSNSADAVSSDDNRTVVEEGSDAAKRASKDSSRLFWKK